jgi:hypothetical protein
MKIMKKIFSLAIIMLAVAANTFAQVTASATATATIVTPIAITKVADMNFGNVAVNATPGTVILAPAGTRTATGGVSLPATAGTVSAATFTVTGVATFTYAITLPTLPLTITSGLNTMTVTGFTSNPSGTGTLPGFGPPNLLVGATLNVGGSQPAGTYVSGTPFDVTVNYN